MGAQGLSSRGIIGRFYAALEQYIAADWIGAASMYFDSNQESETYKWLGQSPVMREWLGGRKAVGLRENGITVVNKKYEATMEIPVDWMRRDKTGQILVRIAEMARRAGSHWGSLLSTLITNGTGATSGLCYDGQYFFDSDHSEGDSGTQLNLLTSTQVAALDVTTAAAPTPVEAAKAILGVIGYMLAYKDDQGEPMNSDARDFLVMTSPVLWQFLAPAVYNTSVNSGEDNPLRSLQANSDFRVRVVANPRLAYTTQFVTLRADAPAAPFIRQEEEGLSVKAIAEGSELEFTEDVHQYGIKALRNVAYGYWQYASHSTLS